MSNVSSVTIPTAGLPRAVRGLRRAYAVWSVATAVLMFLPFLAPLTVIAALVALRQIADSGGARSGRKRSIIALVRSALPALAMLL